MFDVTDDEALGGNSLAMLEVCGLGTNAVSPPRTSSAAPNKYVDV